MDIKKRAEKMVTVVAGLETFYLSIFLSNFYITTTSSILKKQSAATKHFTSQIWKPPNKIKWKDALLTNIKRYTTFKGIKQFEWAWTIIILVNERFK